MVYEKFYPAPEPSKTLAFMGFLVLARPESALWGKTMVSQSGSHLEAIRSKIQSEFEKARGPKPPAPSKQMVRPVCQNAYVITPYCGSVEELYRKAILSLSR